jgi:hypothetical protein
MREIDVPMGIYRMAVAQDWGRNRLFFAWLFGTGRTMSGNSSLSNKKKGKNKIIENI